MLKKSFKMKDLGDTKFSLGLQIDTLPTSIMMHETIYTEKIFKQF